MIINLSHLNSSNGMFWYAMDKIRTIGAEPATVLTGPHLAPLVRKELPHAVVRETGKVEAAIHIVWRKLFCRVRERIVIFTSHPIPFIPRQTVAFYDDYPFAGQTGRLKRLLFMIAARTSRCRVGIINRSLAIPFLEGCGIAQERIFFDSAFPVVDLREAKPRSPIPASPARIGLVGTDSRKKDYTSIFAAVTALGQEREARFVLYGSENDYTRELRREFAHIDFVVVSSDDTSLVAFFDAIDYLISASRAEGYGRPMGLAVAIGVPLFLLKSPVFLEFFGQSALFFDDISSLLRHILDTRPPAVTNTRAERDTSPSRSPFFA